MRQEQARAEENRPSTRVPKPQASPRPLEMLTESLERWLTRPGDWDSTALGPMGKVLGRAEMTARGDRCVPGPDQRLYECVQLRSTGSNTESLYTCGGLEHVAEHDVLPSTGRHGNAES
jgi:hypothetical protein